MKKIIQLFLFTLLLISATYADNYTTPGTGVKWSLSDLVANSGGDVTFSGGIYFVNDTIKISYPDTLYITSDATVKFALNTFLIARGTLIINPPTGVKFTAQDITTGFYGVRVDTSSTTLLRKLTLEYGVSLRISDCSITIDSCIFQYLNNNASTSFGSGAITLFRSNSTITNCQFLNNNRGGITGGANISNAPKIIGCLFQGNDVTNYNTPQINMGSSGTDTIKILNNKILRASTNCGGIGFLPIGDLHAVITGNVIKNNRYGITISGGSNINALISYNQIDSNNIQNSPTLGGSGIAIGGGSATSQQNTIITGNLIRWNLWGVTIQNRAKPNLGNIANADTSDNGKNIFVNNTNATTYGIDLYNNTVDTIYAQNNFWNTTSLDSIEARIFHFVDNSALGPVIFTFPIVPVELSSFTASVNNNSVILNWSTATEKNNSGFEIERKAEGANWQKLGFVAGNGTTTEKRNYSFADASISNGSYSYRLKQIDFDGSVNYSSETAVDFSKNFNYSLSQNYPNPFNPSTQIKFSVAAPGMVTLKVYNILGKEVASLINEHKEAGNYTYNFNAQNLSSGVYFYTVKTGNFVQTKKMTLLR
ncbi:MAG: T9SS type A sorting domain-containing protein [Bacteroidota bacterium]|nr:T9SS type A sorting domain-containing protein [Bacteroidota bacterium]